MFDSIFLNPILSDSFNNSNQQSYKKDNRDHKSYVVKFQMHGSGELKYNYFTNLEECDKFVYDPQLIDCFSYVEVSGPQH